MMRTRLNLVPALAAAALLAAVPARAETTAMLADNRILEKVTLKPGAGPDQVVLEAKGQPPVTVAPQDLLFVDFGKLSGKTHTPMVRLANGDQVYGKVSFPAARQVKIAAGWGSMVVPLSWCTSIRLSEGAALPEPVSKDTLFLANDQVQGELQGVSGGKVSIDVGGKPIPLDITKVQAIGLAPRERPAPPKGGLILGLDLGGGETLTGRWVKMTQDVLTVRTDWDDTLDIPVASIARLEVRNGKLLYLSSLKPSEVRQIAYFDGAVPYKTDRAATGSPLRLAGKQYRRGIGAHSRCELTYTLDGTYEKFASMVGIDDGAGGQGSVVFRVFGDEKLLFESPVVRGGDAPIEVKVDIKKVIVLRLEVDFADNGDVADHADWADARLLRE